MTIKEFITQTLTNFSASLKNAFVMKNGTDNFYYSRYHHMRLNTSTSYTNYMIGLIRLDVFTQHSSGTIRMFRDNGAVPPSIIQFDMQKRYNTTESFYCHETHYGQFDMIKPVVFTYNSIQYAGIYYRTTSANSEHVYIDTVSNLIPFIVPVYNTNTFTILNEEIYNSIVEDAYMSF